MKIGVERSYGVAGTSEKVMCTGFTVELAQVNMGSSFEGSLRLQVDKRTKNQSNNILKSVKVPAWKDEQYSI